MVGPKVNLTSIPLQGYGEPMVAQTMLAGQLMQPLPSSVPIHLGAAGAKAVLAPSVSVVSASGLTSTIVGGMSVAQPLALTTPPSASRTSTSTDTSTDTSSNTPMPGAIRIKQEPKSDPESDAESSSAGTKSTGTSTLPFAMAATTATNMASVKSENLNDSLTLPIPVQQAGKTEGPPEEPPPEPSGGKQVVVKALPEAAVAADSSGGKPGQITMTLLAPIRKVGAPEKRERDETWKNYLIRWVFCFLLILSYLLLVKYSWFRLKRLYAVISVIAGSSSSTLLSFSSGGEEWHISHE